MNLRHLLLSSTLAATPVFSLDVAMQFVGRVDLLGHDEITLLQDLFIMSYNHEDEEARGNGNGNRNGNRNGNGNGNGNGKGNRFVTSVDIDGSKVDVESSTLEKEFVSQSFTLMAQVSCDGCRLDSLFSTKQGHGSFRDPTKFGLDIEVFQDRFNDAIMTLPNELLSVSSLSAVQQIETLSCGSMNDESSVSEKEISGRFALAEGVEESNPEEFGILTQAFIDTYNFLNAHTTSRRCDKSLRRLEKSRDDTNYRRELQAFTFADLAFSFVFRIGFRCPFCEDGSNIFSDDAGRRLMGAEDDVRMEGNNHGFSRSLGIANRECGCPVHADTFGPVLHQEFLSTYNDTIQIMREQGLVTSVKGLVEVYEEWS